MWIRELHTENFRGIKSAMVELPPATTFNTATQAMSKLVAQAGGSGCWPDALAADFRHSNKVTALASLDTASSNRT